MRICVCEGDNFSQCPKWYVRFVCLVIGWGRGGPKMAKKGNLFLNERKSYD